MNNSPNQSDPVVRELTAVLTSRGQAALSDAGSLEQALNQTCSAHPGKVKALVILLEKKAVAYLSNWANDKRPERLTFEQVRDGLAKKFADANVLNAPAAAWAVEAWAAALGMRPMAVAGAAASGAGASPGAPIGRAAAVSTAGAAPMAPAAGAAPPIDRARNAYAPPTAAVEDPHEGGGSLGTLLPVGRGVSMGQGLSWIGGGWRLFKQNPGTWVGVVLILVGMSALSSFLGKLGDVLMFLLSPIFAAGLMLGCRAQEEGEPLEIGHLFAGFKANPLNLILVGLVYLLVVVGVVMVASLVFGAGLAATFMSGNFQAALGPLIVLLALALILGVPVMMAYYYAATLVALNQVGVIEAVKGGFLGGLKNILPLLAYTIVTLILFVLAAIPLLLGWLVMTPVAIASMYSSYRDVFYDD
jgi:uncharacterized membrane protein